MKAAMIILVMLMCGCSDPSPDYKSAEQLISSVDGVIKKLSTIPYEEYHDMLPYIDKLMDSDSNPVLDAIELAQINEFARPYLVDGKVSFLEFEAIRNEVYRVALISRQVVGESNARAKEMAKNHD
jgi:hypothetical protein